MSILAEWEHAGLRCHIRTGTLGYLCGYVDVPESHPCYGKDTDDQIPDTPPLDLEGEELSVLQEDFGVITVFCMAMKGGPQPVPEQLVRVHGGLTWAGRRSDDKSWCFGFDCGHAGDEDRDWNQETVTAETNRLAEQLAGFMPPVGEAVAS